MKKICTYVGIFLAIIYWIFRVVVCFNFSLQREFYFKPMNFAFELAVLFLTVPCMVEIIRRSIVGSLGYFGLYASYFGTMMYNEIVETESGIYAYLTNFYGIIVALGVVIPIFVLIDQLIELNGSKFEDARSTWFYKDEKYSRKIDSRADKNQYKIK